MAVTSLKLPDPLKRRVASVAAHADTTSHAFMVKAIAREVERAELRRQFLKDAVASEREALRSGKAFDAVEVFGYLEAKARKAKAKRPKSRRWLRSG